MPKLPTARLIGFGDDLAPGFDIHISGKDASGGTELFQAIRPLIAGVTYEEDEEMASMLEITVINQPRVDLGQHVDWRAVIDCKAFQEGNTIDLFMGYAGTRHYMGRTEIVKWLPRFPPEGPGTFTIRAYDARHRMMKGNQFKVKDTSKSRKRRTAYRNMADEDIVKKIAEKYGYGVDTDTTERNHRKVTVTKTLAVQDPNSIFGLVNAERSIEVNRAVFRTRVQPSDMTDWDFLQKLAEINRFDLWVDYDRVQRKNIIHFRSRPDAGSAEYRFTYNGEDGSLIEAEPDFSIQEQPTDVEVLYYDSRLRKVQRTTISDINPAENVNLRSAGPGRFQATKTIGKGARVRFSAFGQVIEALADRPFRSKKDAESFVKGWLKERERDFLILRGKIVGIETIRPRQIHEFVGMGKRVDGLYRLTQAKHTQQPGGLYSVEFVGHKVLSQAVASRKTTTQVQTRKTKQQA